MQFGSTAEMVHFGVERRRCELSQPVTLQGLDLPVGQIGCGEDFCVALMQEAGRVALPVAWGDCELMSCNC